MARPKIDHSVRPLTRKASVAHTRLTVARRGLNESAYCRIERILRTDMALAESVEHMIGNLLAVRRDAELGNIDKLRSWVVDSVAEGMAILACYAKEPSGHERAT